MAEGADSSGGQGSWVSEVTQLAGEVGGPLFTAEPGTVGFLFNESHLLEDR